VGIILTWILKIMWAGFNWLKIRSSDGLLWLWQRIIKGGYFLDQVDEYQIVTNSVAWNQELFFLFPCTFAVSQNFQIEFSGLLRPAAPKFNPRRPVAEEGNVLGRRTGLWSTKASWRRLHDTEVVTAVSQTTPSGHRTAPRRVYAFHPHGALLVVTV
jgi:hypothetical protein